MLANKFRIHFRHFNKLKVLAGSSTHLRTSCPNKVLPCESLILSTIRPARTIYTTIVKNKYNRQSSKDGDSDSDDDENDPELKDERDSKVVRVKVNSLRADLLLKVGLSIARNKIEVIFYESKIRVNGQKIPKKSAQLQVGDEIDVIKGFSNVNPSHLIISRVVIISAKEKDENIAVNLRRYKNMLVDNYPGINAYKSSEQST